MLSFTIIFELLIYLFESCLGIFYCVDLNVTFSFNNDAFIIMKAVLDS